MRKYVLLGAGCILLAACEPERYNRTLFYDRPVRDAVIVTGPSTAVPRPSNNYYRPYHHHKHPPLHQRIIVRY